MFLNHCLYLNIHQLTFNSTAIVLLQGGFPRPFCDWVSVHRRMRHQFKCNLIETLNCACTMYLRACVRQWVKLFGVHWWADFETAIYLLLHQTGTQGNHSFALHYIHIWRACIWKKSFWNASTTWIETSVISYWSILELLRLNHCVWQFTTTFSFQSMSDNIIIFHIFTSSNICCFYYYLFRCYLKKKGCYTLYL